MPSTDTNGQERRARRFLPYSQSMGLLDNPVKLRRCQLALLFCSPSHNGNQGFVRVERRVRGPQRAPKLRLLGWLSAAEEIGLGSILKGRTFRCAVELLIFVIRVEEPAPSEAEGTPIAARIPRFAIH